jgi:hypothetical protein
MYSKYFEETIELFSARDEVDCIVLGGSQAVGNHDSFSDFDVYVYLNAPLSLEVRERLLGRTCSFIEMDNTFWEPEDDCTLKCGSKIEMIYCTLSETGGIMHRILREHKAGLGFTTCTCFSVFNGRILYDPKGLYRDMVAEFSGEYPEELRENIIRKNWALLEASEQSFRAQIEKSIKRGDIIMITRRIVGFMNCYLDIIFALNRVYFPGEKYLEKLAVKYCEILPRNFSENLNKLLTLPKLEVMPVVSDMVVELERTYKHIGGGVVPADEAVWVKEA